jgi:pimeloyl-ACP methyl ester carboxylesterase
MLILRLAVGLGLGYLALVGLVWRFQERLAFPAPRAPLPDPRRLGLPHGEVIELLTPDGTKLAGWFLPPPPGQERTGGEPGPGLLWFYGNGENIATIWPVLRDYQPPGTALLVVDYPGYGGSGGRATERSLHAAADAAHEALAHRPGVDPARLYVYGRSLGSVLATGVVARRGAAGLILESPFTNARAMARRHYRLFPRFVVRLALDNLATVARVRCPVLVFHGTADWIVPIEMGREVAAAIPGPVEFVAIEGAGHNDTYDVGGRAYRAKLAAFVLGRVPPVAQRAGARSGDVR